MIQIVEKIKKDIEEFSEKVRSQSTFYLKIKDGEISKFQLGNYIYNLYRLTSLAPIHLEMASIKAENADLKAFFKEKTEEEKGHCDWALNDLNLLGFSPTQRDKFYVTKSMQKLFDQIESLSASNQLSYLVYNLLAEYITVLLAPKILENLERINYSREQISILDKHVELDVNHVKEDFALLDRIFSNCEVDEEDVLKNLNICKACIWSFGEEIIAGHEEAKPVSVDHASEVSAVAP